MSECVGGQVVEEEYNGNCSAESLGTICCQSGEEGSSGGATCITSECDEYTDNVDQSDRLMIKAIYYVLIILSSLFMVIV